MTGAGEEAGPRARSTTFNISSAKLSMAEPNSRRSLPNWLYAITAGIATNRPAAVVMSASEIPGATARMVAARVTARALATKFLVAGLEHRDQGAGLELLGDSGDVLEALRAAEGTQKTRALRPGPPELPRTRDDDGPAKDAEEQQYEKDRFCDRTALQDQVCDLVANGEGKQQQNWHRVSCFAQCALLFTQLIIDQHICASEQANTR